MQLFLLFIYIKKLIKILNLQNNIDKKNKYNIILTYNSMEVQNSEK